MAVTHHRERAQWTVVTKADFLREARSGLGLTERIPPVAQVGGPRYVEGHSGGPWKPHHSSSTLGFTEEPTLS